MVGLGLLTCVEEVFLLIETSDLFLLIEALDPTRGRLTLEVLRFTWVLIDGLVEGVCDFL